MNLFSSLWRHRNEPTVVIFGGALLIVVIVASVLLIYQIFVRNEAIVCGDQWLPKSAACEAQDSVPVGTIVPFFGLLDQVPEGWHVCNGGTITNYSSSFVDADPNVDGTQVPDLRRKFIRGSENPLGSNGLTIGGDESVTIEHAHEWARVNNHRWFSYNDQGRRVRVDDWNDGLGDEGTNEFPLKSHDNSPDLSFYTNLQTLTVDTLPPYVDILYIIRVN